MFLQFLGRVITGLFFTAMIAASAPLADDQNHPVQVPDWLCKKLQALFQKQYPQAVFANRKLDGIQIDFGPEEGGIHCAIHGEKGRYGGQIALASLDGGVQQISVDRKTYKTWFMAPYSAKIDSHLWVVFSYPPDADREFLKQFYVLMSGFQKDAE